MPVYVGSSAINKIYQGGNLIASGQHGITQFFGGDAPAPSDPYWDSVVLLLQDSLEDESSRGLTITWPSGITTGSAYAFAGDNGYNVSGNGTAVRAILPVDSALEFPDDFTIEGWFKPAAMDRFGFFFHWAASSSSSADSLGLRVGAPVDSGRCFFGGNIVGVSKSVLSTTNVRDGNWHHVAVVRSGETISLYVDGVSEGTPITAATTLSLSGGHLGDVQGFFANNLDNEWTGQFDMLRITKGIARYPDGTTFTPPTAPFPNS